MKKFLLGAVALAALVASPAVAADLRARPVYKAPPPITPYFTWTGCYIGGNVGGAYAYKSFSDTAGSFFPFVPGQDLGSHGASGFIGGGQVGCDYQIGSWVIGAQGMFDWANLNGSNAHPNLFFVNDTHIPWVTTATGRLGYTATSSLLVYVKGGAAWVRDNYSIYPPPGGVTSSASVNRSGWDVGGGIEQSFGGGWSWFAEYNYLNFGTHTVTFATNTIPTVLFPIDVRQDMSTFTVGVNYRFGPARY